MGGGGDKKTKTSQTTKLPAWYEDAAKQVISLGQNAASGGYVPYMGPDVAALAPDTLAAIKGTDQFASAFGMPTSGGASYLPEAQDFAGGVKGYSSFPGFEASMEALKTKYPGMYSFLSQFNKINQGQSYSPNQVTPFQSMLSPQFNAMTNNGGTTQSSRPGGKGSPLKDPNKVNAFINMLNPQRGGA